MSWILSLGAGKDQVALIKAIRNEGHKVAAVDKRPDAEGVDLCDAFKAISNRDVEPIVEYARWVGVQGVMVAGSEVADVGAIVAHSLGLPGVSVATAVVCKDKLLQKCVLETARIPCTLAVPVYQGAVKTIFDNMGYRVVVKPQQGSGSRGVTYVDNPMEIEPALLAAQVVCPDVVMERYEPGPQLSVECLVWGGEFWTVHVVDRWYPKGRPVFKEVGGSWPSKHDTAEVAALMQACVRALGVQSGSLKADIVVTPDGPKIIEVTPRLSGGPLWGIIRDGTGIDYLRCAVQIALGHRPIYAAAAHAPRNIARLMDGTDVPWEEREKYLGYARHS